jgi:hypothetical protein
VNIFWSPAEIITYVQEVNQAFHAFNQDVLKNKGVFSALELDLWTNVLENYHAWLSDLTWFSYTHTGTVDVAERYALQLQDWIKLFNSRSSVKTSGPGTDIIAPSNAYTPLVSASLFTKEQSEKLGVVVVCVAAATALTAIAKIIRG